MERIVRVAIGNWVRLHILKWGQHLARCGGVAGTKKGGLAAEENVSDDGCAEREQ